MPHRRKCTAMTNETHLTTALSCPGCTAQLTRFQTGLLEEIDAAAVREHLAACPDCRLFADQIDLVADFVGAGSGETTDVSDNLSNLLGDFAHSTARHPRDLSTIVRSLTRLAHSLDANAADDLVQHTLLAALEADPEDLDPMALARDLTDRAFSGSASTVRSLTDYETRREHRTPDPDPDGDTAELFYPDFYDSGPDVGRHIESPNRWGEAKTLSPDDDVLTADLYGIVDDAIARLPDPLRQLVQLVDIDDLSVSDASHALRLDQDDAVDALHRARVHLRGVVDKFVTVGP